ncbi:MAG TPA: aldo/keto reductase [Pyrinomonadaceae bacterium]|jgi:aryl-alcohol dehydrogenase-like predicted oxidoreductase|nr:aldo/keto reductase [Pyrinomonadaceae bacterium]
MASRKSSGEIPRRPLGRTGVTVSALALGGYHLALAKTKREAIRIVREAIDAGVTFMDNAWEYHEGKSEELMGEALAGRREEVFLMSKVCTHGRDRKVAMRQLEQSLRRLKTDRLDLWQVHEVVHDNDPDLHFAAGGVIEALEQAKREGKVRFVGFTGHKDPSIHLKMLSHDYPFDTCQLPLNCLDATFRSFEQRVLPELIRRGIAPLGMKSLCGTGDPARKRVVAATDALRYAMSLPVASTVSGIDSLRVLRQNLGVARGFVPMTEGEMRALRERVAADAADGHLELYKTSKHFDGPPGRKQHKFPPLEELAA